MAFNKTKSLLKKELIFIPIFDVLACFTQVPFKPRFTSIQARAIDLVALCHTMAISTHFPTGNTIRSVAACYEKKSVLFILDNLNYKYYCRLNK